MLVKSLLKNLVCRSPLVISLCHLSIAQAVYAGISDPKYQYIYDITDDFCERKDVKDKYIPLVGNLCPKLLEVSWQINHTGSWINISPCPYRRTLVSEILLFYLLKVNLLGMISYLQQNYSQRKNRLLPSPNQLIFVLDLPFFRFMLTTILRISIW